MQAKDIMSRNVEVVLPSTYLSEVARRMHQRDCGCILIAEKDRLVGVITDRDLVIRGMSEGHNPGSTKAEHLMTKKVLYCRNTDEALDVSLNMAKNKIRRLPVLDENKRLVGIISLGDIAANLEDYNVCGKAMGHICAAPPKS
ncbi:MAG: CBS domain-containing protein [Alphaproteobacteria bacterium]|nr:CBS domain-containing protein [Alphaproteobacteria bacterium]